MISLKRKQSGFTIVELLIVIVVIGILAALVVTTFSGIQQKGRDKERQTDINAVHQQVEAYYAQEGKYPSLSQVNTASFRQASMKGLDAEALKDPKGTAQTLVAAPAANSYAYAVLASDDTACDNTSKDCTKYTLTATNEGSPATYAKSSLN